MSNHEIEMQSELNSEYDYKLGMYSGLDPIQELANDSGCSRAEYIAWMNRPRPVVAKIVKDFDSSVPF